MFFISKNIVSSMNMDCKLDLKTIALHAKNVKYNLKIDFFLWLGYFIFLLYYVVWLIMNFLILIFLCIYLLKL